VKYLGQLSRPVRIPRSALVGARAAGRRLM
jgi:hypothetical protein